MHADEKRKGENEEAAAGRAGFKPSMLIDYEHSRPMELQVGKYFLLLHNNDNTYSAF